MIQSTVTVHNEKAVRLIDYLLKLALLRSKSVRTIDTYEKTLWIKDIPLENECFTQAWDQKEDYNPDIWIEVQNRKEPELPRIPEICAGWIDESSLRNKNELSDLFPEITKQVENPDWREGSDEPEFLSLIIQLEDHQEVQQTWEKYLEKRWLPWTEAHNIWESIHHVYTTLFTIYQEQLRLGEEFELVLGLGLLSWQTPGGYSVRRHLIVANASLKFNAQQGKFTVCASPDGANLRPELDMLDIQEQPSGAVTDAKKTLATSADDPWENDCVTVVLQALVHSISPDGEYESSLEAKKQRVSEKPLVEYAPTLILRKRSTKGLTDTLERIKDNIENGGLIPSEFGGLTETPPTSGDNDNVDPGDTNCELVSELYFPKPSNDEQRRIVEKISTSSGVLVQGHPGTGKSHTIANLISHLLATGQRTLITAQTPRALQVLKDLVPEELRPLCINLLGSGLEEKRSLESSIGGILRKNEEWNEEQARQKRDELELKLHDLRQEKVSLIRRLQDIRESETHAQSIAEGNYKGTAAQIAKAVHQKESSYKWFTDTPTLNKTCPVSESDLRPILDALRHFVPDKRHELSLICPDSLQPVDGFASLVNAEQKAIEEEVRSGKGADEQIAEYLTRVENDTIESLRDSLELFQSKLRSLPIATHPWVSRALSDVLNRNPALWKKLHQVTSQSISTIESLVSLADNTNITLPDNIQLKKVIEDISKLIEHMKSGGKLGWGLFRPKLVKERMYILKTVRVNGRLCASLEQLFVLSDALKVRLECERAWGFWAGHCEKTKGHFVMQFAALEALYEALGKVLSIEILIVECRKKIQQHSAIIEPVWAEESQVEQLIASCTLAMARQVKDKAVMEISGLEVPLVLLMAKNSVHPVVSELINAIRNRNIEAYAHAVGRNHEMVQERERLRKIDSKISEIKQVMPNMIEDITQTYNESYWENQIASIKEAWHWAQAKQWIDVYIRKEDSPALAQRVKQIESEISSIISRLASLLAWSFCFARLQDTHRQHMEAWQQSMKRIGKGTGKHAPHHRREAQKHLNQCREAVPGWVMPLHRVWDTIEPSPEMFDVIIVDEASQCGVEALPLLYLGKKVLIVGDDKQISPAAVGIPRNDVYRLMKDFLFDYDYQSTFDVESSLFEHGKRLYSRRQITLREHFRCMPEIIRFSNDLCYTDTPLIPLRQFGSDRLTPLERVFVDSGYREGKANRVINRPESQEVVAKIVELCCDERYEAKTMGVIVLQGDAQASLIEQELLNQIGAEEIEKRRIVCGNPYSFQGDERDVIFLSMVAAPNTRIGALTKPEAERRFNVAASRARDQMWLFHSVTIDDLSKDCLRRKLLEFFENSKPLEIAGIDLEELERRAYQDNRSTIKPPKPYDSWFELNVALELARKGYIVIPQYEFGGKWIDLVVQHGSRQLAIECDGDNWHGADRYEADMQRQRQLERCGWEFFRVRESAFYSNKAEALKDLWLRLQDRGIFPGYANKPESDNDDNRSASNNRGGESERNVKSSSPFTEAAVTSTPQPSHPLTEIPTQQIRNAILAALSKCPNNSCTEDSITKRVLKELDIITRGQPRKAFEQRIKKSVNELVVEDLIEKYRAKNKRLRLI
ncbi:MAG: AAA family ATPase [Candidatus Cloacimonetes bacterium]|nr:AAA family ATPase [Candidatus Cloacimonadota bacterium]